MSIESERHVSEDAPTPTQLRRLAFIGVKSAAQRERLKSLNRVKGVHYFIDELDLLGDFQLEEDTPTQVRHRLAMRVGVRPPEGQSPKIWSLKFFDTYSVEARPGQWLAGRSVYRFEWTRNRAIMADRAIRLVGFGDYVPDQLDDYLDNLSFSDDAANILAVSEEMRMVTADDCDDLTEDIASYLSTLDTVGNR